MRILELDGRGIVTRYTGVLVKTVSIFISLYLFVCSLTFLSSSFRILGGRNLSSLFSSSDVLSNPVVGVMIGILVTVLVQSSATSTSIIVSLVSAGVKPTHAIPMIFGSNIGTSVTNTIVSMTQAADREVFRRAFAAATVHDMFNWLSVVCLLILEVTTGALESLTKIIVDSIYGEDNATLGSEFLKDQYIKNHSTSMNSPDILKTMTKPFTNTIVRLDKKILIGWSIHDPKYDNVTSIVRKCASEDGEIETCNFLLSIMGEDGWGLNDTWLGLILLGFSLTLLCFCLIALMKILNSMLGGHMAELIQRTINAEIPYVPWLTGYVGILIGTLITILVRSSSVFTSTLTPLCGAGLVSLETAYPMTLGSNIGTTTTALLASFAAEGKYLKPSVQTALVHLFFNIIGILIFYPIPCMRIPLPLARGLGNLTAEYRWFAGFYLLSMFFLLPAMVFLLSLAGPTALYMVLIPVVLMVVVVALVNLLQNKKPSWLPPFLRDWSFLPLWMRSLKPIDDVFSKLRCCQKCQGGEEPVATEDKEFDDVEAGLEGHHLSIIKLKTKDDNANKLDGCNELESLVVNGYGPPKIMQNTDLISVDIQNPVNEMRQNDKMFISNGGIYGKAKG